MNGVIEVSPVGTEPGSALHLCQGPWPHVAREIVTMFIDQFAVEFLAGEYRNRREAQAMHERCLHLLGRGPSPLATRLGVASSGWVRVALMDGWFLLAARRRRGGSSP